MASRPARVAMLEQLKADGVPYMFGNPGTVEQGFLDELRGFPEIEYVLALQEAAVVGLADGYARATRKPALIQLHSGVGLGNGIGMLYQAMRGHAPLVVVVGEAGLAYDAMEAQMAADLVAMAEPVTKWATRVVDPNSTLRVLRRAFKTAGAPPYGPVLVVLPADVLDGLTDEAVVPTSYPVTTSLPAPETVERAAELLAGAQRPLVIAGDGVHFSGAQAELARLAEVWGAEVWGADWAEVNLPVDHPAYRGQLGHMFGSVSSRVTAAADAVLVVGTYVLPEVFPALDGVFAPGAPVVHVDLDSGAIAKNFPVDLGIVADPRRSLGLLADAIGRRAGSEQARRAAERLARWGREKASALVEAVARDDHEAGGLPLTAAAFGRALADRLPAGAVLFDEALTSSRASSATCRRTRRGSGSRPAAARWASASPARSAPNSPTPTARWSASPATAVRCTPSRRSGRPPATASPPSSSSATTGATSCSTTTSRSTGAPRASNRTTTPGSSTSPARRSTSPRSPSRSASVPSGWRSPSRSARRSTPPSPTPARS
ncbi:hypothetical protein GCM10025734_65020 [Kitasatospora paranensis]